MGPRGRALVGVLGLVVTLLGLLWAHRGWFPATDSLVQMGFLWVLGSMPYAVYYVSHWRLRLVGPGWGFAVGVMGVGLPAVGIVPAVSKTSDGGFALLLTLPVFIGLAIALGTLGGAANQWLRRHLLRERGPAVLRALNAWTAPIGALIALTWSALVWPSVAMSIAPCERVPPPSDQETGEVPDTGSRIVFASYQGNRSWGERLRSAWVDREVSAVYAMPLDGSDVVRLTPDACHYSAPRWSPDGSQVAFLAERSAGAGLYSLRLDGHRLRRVTAREVHGLSVEWSPDGSLVGYYDLSEDSIRFVDVDHQRDRRVADLKESSVCPCLQIVGQDEIAYVDGKRLVRLNLASRSQRDVLLLSEVDVDEVVSTTNPRISDFRISPDGGSVALVKERWIPTSGAEVYGTEIFVAKTDGSRVRRLTPRGRSESSPTWSTDSRTLVFDSSPVGIRDVMPQMFSMEADGTNRRRLTPMSGLSPHLFD